MLGTKDWNNKLLMANSPASRLSHKTTNQNHQKSNKMTPFPNHPQKWKWK